MNTFNEIFDLFINFIVKKIQYLFELEFLRLYEDNEIDNIKQDYNSLLHLKNDIFYLCEEIKILDNEIIKICEAINQAYKTHNKKENKYKEFKAYFKINSSINKYIEELMIVNVGNKQPIKDKFIKEVKNYDNLNLFQFDTEKNKVYPTLMVSPQIKQNNSPKIEEFNESQNSESPVSADYIKIEQCNIDFLLALTIKEYHIFNAIFEYGIYKKKLNIIYSRLKALYELINKTRIKEETEIFIKNLNFSFQYIDEIIKNLNNDNLLFNNLNKEEKNHYNNKSNKFCRYTIYTHLNDLKNQTYKYKLYKFFYVMIYIYTLFIYTYGKKKFIKNIREYFTTNNEKIITNAGWNLEIMKELKKRVNTEQKEFSDQYCYLVLNEYIIKAHSMKIFNTKIIEKIFNKNINDIEPFYIIYNIKNISYELFMKKDIGFNFLEKNKEKNHIRIIKDSNDNYINLFSNDNDQKEDIL
jgi:hypothetical protein